MVGKTISLNTWGYRIEVGEIERAVLSIKLIDNTCVFYDLINKKITCHFVSEDSNVDKVFLIKELQTKIPRYMIPTIIIKCPVLPISSTGKIDRALIEKRYFEQTKLERH